WRKVGLAAAPARPPADGFAFQPLAGGLGRRAFLASCGEHQWVVRLAGADRAGALDLVDEARITAEAASFEIAPRVVACDEAAGVLVTEHLRGARPVDARTLKSTEGRSEERRVGKECGERGVADNWKNKAEKE